MPEQMKVAEMVIVQSVHYPNLCSIRARGNTESGRSTREALSIFKPGTKVVVITEEDFEALRIALDYVLRS